MKKTTLLNAPLSRMVAAMGHTDAICVADAGFPIPGECERIDLAVCPGVPSFLNVLDAVLSEFMVEEIVLAKEIQGGNPDVLAAILERFPGMDVTYIPHEEFKIRSKSAKALVRTGECSPYANILLYSGVTFR